MMRRGVQEKLSIMFHLRAIRVPGQATPRRARRQGIRPTPLKGGAGARMASSALPSCRAPEHQGNGRGT